MTLIDVLILIVVIAAAVAGFRSLGGGGRAGSLLGLFVGAGLCSALGARLAELGTDPASRQVLLIVGSSSGCCSARRSAAGSAGCSAGS